MAKRSVVWTETAVRQRREILKYWITRNGNDLYAQKLLKIIRNKVKVILAHPESGILSEYPETRMSALGHFSLFYRISDTQIIITAFWDNRQDPSNLLAFIQKPNGA